MRGRLAALSAGLIAIAGVALGSSPAGAASGYCSGSGINAVVDFGALGGGIQKFCDPGGDGKTAGQVFEDVGAHLTRVSNYQGAVCRVEGEPSNASCTSMPPADAYWGLFWSDGKTWSYSSSGVDGLKVPDGGTVAFAWQASSKKRNPGTAPASPTRSKPTPEPHPTPTQASSPGPTARPAKPASSATPAGSSSSSNPSAGPAQQHHRHRALPAAKVHRVAVTSTKVHGALCSGGSGIGVVVDHRSLGGGIAEGCAARGAGMPGNKVFPAAGFPLRYMPNQPGFVCAVARVPRTCAMPGAGDPYWGLFWTDGKSGRWRASSVAITQLKVSVGGAMALVWEDGPKTVGPAVAAPVAGSTTSPTDTPSATPLTTATQMTSAPVRDGGGVPTWVPIVVILVLLLGGGGFAVVRRRGTA
jgi:hypothetical protein